MLVPIVSLVFFPLPLWAQETLLLDCTVTKVSPLFQDRGTVEVLLMERYRFLIIPGSPAAAAATPRSEALPAQVTQSETQYQIDFENKRVVIDRLTAEFQVGVRGAPAFFASGTCKKLGEPKF